MQLTAYGYLGLTGASVTDCVAVDSSLEVAINSLNSMVEHRVREKVMKRRTVIHITAQVSINKTIIIFLCT